MVYKFSPTSPIRTHAHQLLNTRQSKGFEDFKELVLHAILHDHVCCMATGAHTCAYFCQWARHVLTHEARHGELSVDNLSVQLGKWETHPYIACLPLLPMRGVYLARVSLFPDTRCV
jgi:hypothetical protein